MWTQTRAKNKPCESETEFLTQLNKEKSMKCCQDGFEGIISDFHEILGIILI